MQVICIMKIAVLGKGGSGKSTVASHLVGWFFDNGWNVLAIDADHNMDLGFNLGVEPSNYLGDDPDAIKEYLSHQRTDTFGSVLKSKAGEPQFSINPIDQFTDRFSIKVKQNLRLMTAGPHTDRVRSQEACSHSLAAPLKVYLPLLKLEAKQAVIVDERAGTDPVATGILNGIDLAIVVREQTPNSQRVAEQITDELKLSGVPYLVFDNKVAGLEEDMSNIAEQIRKII